MSERQYRVVWVIDDAAAFRRVFGSDPSTLTGVHCPGPFTHREALTVLRKQTAHMWRRSLIEEIDQ